MKTDISLSSSKSRWRYHVFLSFRGTDTRQGFTGHLHAALQRKGLIAFIDNERLGKGEDIAPELLRAIEDSLCTIVILSSNYASSTWCLDELVKALDCHKGSGRFVFPIFYGIDPSVVRHQRGSFAEAFHEHKIRFGKNKERVQRWRQALIDVANLSGWDSRISDEVKLIKEVVQFVWQKLSPILPSFDDGLVGKSRLKKIVSLLRMDSDDVHFVGIWGMDGIGKTTLARIIYERFRHEFEMSCFLANVREVCERSDGLVSLQRKILSHLDVRSIEIEDLYEGNKIIRNLLYTKKILLVLDDISTTSQLENLAETPEWFGPGSRVIVTTRDVNLLISQGGLFETYEVEILNPNDSFKLFCQNAFKRDQPKEGYLELSERAVAYAGGNPLALKVLGHFLFGRGVSEWEDALDDMKDEFVTFIRTKLIKKSPLQSLGTMKLHKFQAKEEKDQMERGKREMKIEDETTTSMNGEQKQIMMIDQEDEIIVSDDETEESFEVGHCQEITVPKEEKKKSFERWRYSLIVKLHGKKLECNILLQRLEELWDMEGKFSVSELRNDYFVVKFTKEKDYFLALHSGPRLMDGHYLLVQRWRPGFDPFDDEVKRVPVWIRITGLPLECYDTRFLRKVGNSLGKTLGVDNSSFIVSKARFARICVDLDLNKPLISRFQLKKKIYSVEYEEGCHQICFKCGQFGHEKKSCPSGKFLRALCCLGFLAIWLLAVWFLALE